MLKWWLDKIIAFFSSAPGLMFMGGVLAYVIGYLSVYILGPHNVIEELAEVVLKKQFDVDVVFEDDTK